MLLRIDFQTNHEYKILQPALQSKIQENDP
jgi:hypothetical protein